ncbi:hypothetical protein [Burkholderia cepacia]|uniref:hypothetical protein n=1 Tax=Burkholderia cepacia TaxID=292 RepID=UPI00158B33D8|nr:hypothetical protein [Burkholderia cepacia]
MSTNSEKYEKNVIVEVGEKDGVLVKANPDLARYEITTPNNYDVYFNMNFRDYCQAFEPTLKAGETKDWSKKHFFIPIEQLDTSEKRESFNIKVKQARKINREFNQEITDIKQKMFDKKDLEEIQKVFGEIQSVNDYVVKEGIPQFKNQQTQKLEPGFHVGKVLSVAKYHVFFDGRNKDGKHFIQAIESSRLLSSNEFKDRLQSLEAKFKEGDEMYLSFNKDTKKASIITKTEWQKDIDKGLTVEQADENVKQRAFAKQQARGQVSQQINESEEKEVQKEQDKEVKQEVKKSRSKSKSKETELSL